MTSRERINTVMAGDEPDRLPVWLKIPFRIWKARGADILRGMNYVEIQRALGCDPVYMTVPKVNTTYRPEVTLEVVDKDDERITHISTPDGPLIGVEGRARDGIFHPTRHMVDSADTLRRLRWIYTGAEYSVEPDSERELGHWFEVREKEDVCLFFGSVISPLMTMVEFLAGPVNTVYLLHDEPELFREIMDIMRSDRIRYLRSILPHIPTDMFKLSENTSTNLISPSMFEEFCMPVLGDYAEIVMEHDAIPVHHMCGLIGDLLERIDSLPTPVNEAFTTRPMGDVTLAEGRARMPSKVLLGGTNAALWMRPAHEIVEAVRKDLSVCPDRRKVFLTSGGGLPPDVPFEKARRVVEAFKTL